MSEAVSLWPHQVRGIDALRASLRKHRRVVGVAPTGAGKTVLGGWMARESIGRGYRVLWIAHTRELVAQPLEQFQMLGLCPGVIQSKIAPTPDARVQLATIQTLVRREMPPADLVVFDEAHLHIGTDSANRVLAHYPNAWIIGLSASPWRLDGRSFSSQYDDLVVIASPEELIECGILVRPRYFDPSRPDLSDVRTTDGDYEPEGLALACDKPQLIGDIVESYCERARGRQALLFAVSVQHSRNCRDALLGAGVRAAHLDGDTPTGEREWIISEFKAGRIDVICNVEVLTTGFDHRALSCVIVARPTKSVALWMQMVGRALRACHGKTDAIVLDHSDNTQRLGYAHVSREWSLERAKKKPAAPGMTLTTCKKCFAVYESHVVTCPECGHVRIVEQAPVRIGKGTLTEVSVAFTPDQKKREFQRLCDEAIRYRCTRDYVKQKYRKAFGMWPRGVTWPAGLPVDRIAEQAKFERIATAKGYGSKWVEQRMRAIR